MSLQRVLNEDWSEYDNRKLRGNPDDRKFSCTEQWEVDYLAKKISRITGINELTVRNAIAKCCQLSGNRERNVFVKCVMDRLS